MDVILYLRKIASLPRGRDTHTLRFQHSPVWFIHSGSTGIKPWRLIMVFSCYFIIFMDDPKRVQVIIYEELISNFQCIL